MHDISRTEDVQWTAGGEERQELRNVPAVVGEASLGGRVIVTVTDASITGAERERSATSALTQSHSVLRKPRHGEQAIPSCAKPAHTRFANDSGTVCSSSP